MTFKTFWNITRMKNSKKKERKKREKKEKKRAGSLKSSKENKTSRPKALNGQQFPCPALHSLVLLGGGRTAAPIGDKVL